MVSYLSEQILEKLMDDNFDIADIYSIIYPDSVCSVQQHEEENIGEFAERMKGCNDTLVGVIKDIIKKGQGEKLTHNFPYLAAWIEKETNDELNRGYQVALECALESGKIDVDVCDIWFPEIDAYSIVVYTLERFIALHPNMQKCIAGGIV